MDTPAGGRAPEPMDYAWDGSLAMPAGGCRCTRWKWKRTCRCLRCLEHFGERHLFEYLPALMPRPVASDPLRPRAAKGLDPAPPAAGNMTGDLTETVLAGLPRLASPDGKVVGPLHPQKFFRAAGIATFCRLPEVRDLQTGVDIAVLGIPFDSGCSFRPGARFGPESIRSNSRLIRPYLIAQDQKPLFEKQIADAGDVGTHPFGIDEAVDQITRGCRETLGRAKRLMVIGGDHTLSYPVMKAVAEKYGPLALIHFDAHLDTFPPQFGQDIWHGSPFRKCWEEGLLAGDCSTHVGIRATTWGKSDLEDSDRMGIATLTAEDVHERGVDACAEVVRERCARAGPETPVYLSIDIDVLDPSVAPGTGTPEFGGLLAHQLLRFVRQLKGLQIVSADVVEVCPAYDHAGITAMAAANLVLESIALMTSVMQDQEGG